MKLSESIKHEALRLGFDVVGITTADAIAPRQADYLRNWLEQGRQAQMAYMNRNFDKRIDPSMLLQDARSVVCTALSYKLSADEIEACRSRSNEPLGTVADFALFDDYHVFMKGLLNQLCDYISSCAGSDAWKFKICVDSVPIAERSLAQRAGLGFIGRNHMLTNVELGSQILLGLLVTDIQLDADGADDTKCCGCDKCIKACPTGALSADGGFDSARCISYLTIEHKGDIARDLAEKMGDRLFGCDECSIACPYTGDAPGRKNMELKLHPQRRRIKLNEIIEWTQQDFDKLFAGSTVERTGLERLKRNARVCLKNQGARNVSDSSKGTSRPS